MGCGGWRAVSVCLLQDIDQTKQNVASWQAPFSTLYQMASRFPSCQPAPQSLADGPALGSPVRPAAAEDHVLDSPLETRSQRKGPKGQALGLSLWIPLLSACFLESLSHEGRRESVSEPRHMPHGSWVSLFCDPRTLIPALPTLVFGGTKSLLEGHSSLKSVSSRQGLHGTFLLGPPCSLPGMGEAFYFVSVYLGILVSKRLKSPVGGPAPHSICLSGVLGKNC